jgi:hypothetical protein
MPDYLRRYLAGERRAVWAELYQFGSSIREDPQCWEAAQDVVRAMMERARFNVELLVGRLTSLDYRFRFPGQQIVLPVSMPADLAEIEAMAGLLPLALRQWLLTVGNVDLMGVMPDEDGKCHPAWQETYADPLVVQYDLDYFQMEYEDWQWQCEYDELTDPFCIEFAPDEYHKDNVSGGAPYCIALPQPAVDAPILYQWHSLDFVEYLRQSFEWGGFFGLSRARTPPLLLIAELRRDLLPI